MTELISKEDVSKALKLERIKLKILAPAIMKLLKLGKVNKAYFNAQDKKGSDFTDSLLKEFGVEYEVSDEDLNNIPKTGSFIMIANHPYGGIDGLILMSVLNKIRPDMKFVANYLLKQIKPLKDYIIAVNPFENSSKKGINVTGVKQILAHLKSSPLCIFPAGEVSSLNLNNLKISDKKWEPAVGRIIHKACVNVIPVYISGHNSIGFNLLGLLHPGLRTIKLPSEMLNKRNHLVKVRIGKPIPFKEISNSKGDELLNFLRAKTYALGASDETYFKFKIDYRNLNGRRQIIEPVKLNTIEKELNGLNPTCNLFNYENFSVYIANASEIPNVLKEISRLREITFREIGEGTNLSNDTDVFDLYYKHLFIWDTLSKKIVGAYRLGEGDVLFRRFGVKGFYLNQLFKMENHFYPVLYRSLELGRSFVVQEYQRKPVSLMLLWKGINVFLKENSERFDYLIGPVSISNSFSNLSKDLLVAYIRHKHWDNKLAKWVKPRKRFHYKSKTEGKKLLMHKHSEDFKLLDNFIGEIEGSQKLKVPVLVKKYLKLNGKIIAFNVDPDFNDSLDGFLMVDIKKIPEEAFEIINR